MKKVQSCRSQINQTGGPIDIPKAADWLGAMTGVCSDDMNETLPIIILMAVSTSASESTYT